MVPSLCSTRTKLPEGSVPRPLWRFSVFTTTPPRAAMIGVPSGMAMSMAYRLLGPKWLYRPLAPWVRRKGPPRQGSG